MSDTDDVVVAAVSLLDCEGTQAASLKGSAGTSAALHELCTPDNDRGSGASFIKDACETEKPQSAATTCSGVGAERFVDVVYSSAQAALHIDTSKIVMAWQRHG
jgi:hypothetical protein